MGFDNTLKGGCLGDSITVDEYNKKYGNISIKESETVVIVSSSELVAFLRLLENTPTNKTPFIYQSEIGKWVVTF